MSNIEEIRRIVGYGLPYVYVHRIRIDNSTILQGDKNYYQNNNLEVIKNKFGRNVPQQKTNVDDKEYDNDNVIQTTLNLRIPEMLRRRKWYQKLEGQSLSVTVIQSSHPQVSEILNSTDRYNEELIPLDLRKFVVAQTVALPQNIDLHGYKDRDMGDDVLCFVPLEVSFKSNSSHLRYFLYSEMANRVGAKTIEKVLDNNNINSKTTTFYLPSGEVWAGPVHYHEGVWMAGPRHTRRPHPTLEKVDHNNVKIQDFRTIQALNKIQNDILFSVDMIDVRTFSSLFLSRDAEGSARGIFAMNPTALLAKSSRYNRLFITVAKEKLLKYTKIQSLKIVRRKIENKNINDYDYVNQAYLYDIIAESSDDDRGILQRKSQFTDANGDGIVEKYIGSVTEKRLTGLGNKRAFSFHDQEIKDFQEGTFQYGVEITSTDPTVPYMKRVIKGLKRAHSLMKEYYDLMNNKSYFDNTGDLSDRAVRVVGKFYSSRDKIEAVNSFNDFPWRRSIRIYLSILSELSGRNANSYARRLFSMVGPSSRSLEGVEAFLSLLQGFIKTIQTFAPPDEQEYSKARSVAKSNKKQNVNTITTTYFFDSKFDSGMLNGYGVDYYGNALVNNYTGPLSISLPSFLARFRQEAGKRGMQVPSGPQAAGYRDFYSKLSPATVRAGAQVYELDDPRSAREASIHLLANKTDQNTAMSKVPSVRTTTYETLQKILGQNGKSAKVRRAVRRRRRKDYSDPTTHGGAQGSRSFDSTEVLPNKLEDGFNSNPTRDAGKNEPEVLTVDETMLDSIVGVGANTLLDDYETGIRYVTSFDDNMEPTTVDAPYASPNPYMAIFVGDSQAGDDTLNEVVVVQAAQPEAQPVPVQQENTPVTETEQAPIPEEYEEEPVITLTSVADNAESIIDSVYNTGAEESVRVETVRITRNEITTDVAQTVASTTTQVENEQVVVTGTTTRNQVTTGGSTGGY